MVGETPRETSRRCAGRHPIHNYSVVGQNLGRLGLWVGRAIAGRLRGMGTPLELHELADAGHFVTEEQPASVAHLLAAWLDRHEPVGQGSR